MNMKLKYRKVDTKEYIKSGLADGSLKIIKAKKYAKIRAKKGKVGQTIVSWAEDNVGNPIQEKIGVIQADDWIATKIDTEGNQITDRNGHTNSWIISNNTLRKKYKPDPKIPMAFNPVDEIQKFVEIGEPLTLCQSDKKMNMPKGSFINITDPNNLYAINPKDFHDTYIKINNS